MQKKLHSNAKYYTQMKKKFVFLLMKISLNTDNLFNQLVKN